MSRLVGMFLSDVCKRRHLFDNEAKQQEKWIVDSVWKMKWFLGAIVRTRRWMFTCDEDVSFFFYATEVEQAFDYIQTINAIL